MTFEDVLPELKNGRNCCRWSWYPGGVAEITPYITLLPEAEVIAEHCHTEPLRSIAQKHGKAKCLATIRMIMANDEAVLTGWLPTVDDILAADWCAFGEPNPSFYD